MPEVSYVVVGSLPQPSANQLRLIKEYSLETIDESEFLERLQSGAHVHSDGEDDAPRGLALVDGFCYFVYAASLFYIATSIIRRLKNV